MTNFVFANFAHTLLSADLTDLDQVVNVEDTTVFPDIPPGFVCRCTIWDGIQAPEIVDITSLFGAGQFQLVRAQEDTVARNWLTGSRFWASITKGVFAELTEQAANDVGFFYSGKPVASETLCRIHFVRRCHFEANFAESAVSCLASSTPTGTQVINVWHGTIGGSETQVGTFTWSAGQQVPVLAGSAFDPEPLSYLDFRNQNPADATFGNVAVVLKANKEL